MNKVKTITTLFLLTFMIAVAAAWQVAPDPEPKHICCYGDGQRKVCESIAWDEDCDGDVELSCNQINDEP